MFMMLLEPAAERRRRQFTMSEHKERSPVVLKEVITKEMINYMEALKNFK